MAFVLNAIWIPYAVALAGIWIGVEGRSDGDWLGMGIIVWALCGILGGSLLGVIMSSVAIVRKMPLALFTLISGVPSVLSLIIMGGAILGEFRGF